MAKRKSITAAGLMAQLENDPGYQLKNREHERKREERSRLLDEDERELVRELREAGIHVVVKDISGKEYEGAPRSVWDLVNSNEPYPAAVPILMKHVTMEHDHRIKDGIVRALATDDSCGVASTTTLIQLFQDETDPESNMKSLLGRAIAYSATYDDAMTICDLMGDDSHGKGREYLPLALVHCPEEPARAILEPLVNHPHMGEYAAKAISILNSN